jgi:uncharacterized protein
MFDLLKETFERLIAHTDLGTKRALFDRFLPKRLTGLIGPRGVGKTTLMLQYIKEHDHRDRKTFYFSADSVYFRQSTLLEFVDKLYKFEGYRVFFIDEIHQYKNWNQELKNIYDSYPDIKIIFSGSSMLELLEGSHDLSRRVNIYHLPGLSFREYLSFTQKLNTAVVPFKKLLNDPKEFSSLGNIPTVLGHFRTYLEKGYYPFIFEDPSTYAERIMQIVTKIIFEDIPNCFDLKTANLHHFKQLLGYLASIPPGETNTNNIARNIGLAHQTIDHYLHILDRVGLITLVYPFEGGSQHLRKPKKIFIHNTTLLNVLNSLVGSELNQGNVRELFFLQSLRDAEQQVFYSNKGDYRVDNHLFEIGGKNKTGAQLQYADLPGILVKDDILHPRQNTIPLFYFGFLN